MTDISKEAVERLAQDCDTFERMSVRGGTLAHLHFDCAKTIRAQSARIEELEAQVAAATMAERKRCEDIARKQGELAQEQVSEIMADIIPNRNAENIWTGRLVAAQRILALMEEPQ